MIRARFAAALVVTMMCLSSCSSGGVGAETEVIGTETTQDIDAAAEAMTPDVAEDPPEVVQESLPFAPAGPGVVPDPIARGPFPVGVMTVDLYDDTRIDEYTGKGRMLRTDIWYPATQAYAGGPYIVADLQAEAVGIDFGDKTEIIMNADIPRIEMACSREAEIDATHGPYPVILFSHGANGIRWQSIFYTIHLASHGYIVMSPDHAHNTIWEILADGFQGDSLTDSLPERPLDMEVLLEQLLVWSKDPGHRFFGMVDEEHIGATGHSLGAITSTALACRDERIKATVLHSPQIFAGLTFGYCLGQPFPVPVMVQGGTEDGTLKYCAQYCEYKEHLTTAPAAYMYELVSGGHFTFSDICQLDLQLVTEELDLGDAALHTINDGCGEENAPYKAAHQSINHYATAFWNAYLRGSTGSLDLLVDMDEPPHDNVNFWIGDVPDFWGEGGCAECTVF